MSALVTPVARGESLDWQGSNKAQVGNVRVTKEEFLCISICQCRLNAFKSFVGTNIFNIFVGSISYIFVCEVWLSISIIVLRSDTKQ